jgi:hypothetical protein
MQVRVLAALALLGVGVVAANGCGTGAVDVDACKQIEGARCRQAPACGIALQPPYSTNDGDVDACIRFYDVACLKGLAVNDPGPAAVNACVAAIQADTPQKDNCAVVKEPQTDPTDCGWLAPSATTVVDAGTATDAADAE